MNEFIKKLIKEIQCIFCDGCTSCKVNQCDGVDKEECSWMIRIKNTVNQLAEEYNNGWIPVSERLPDEQESIFAKLKGTDKWSSAMFEKASDVVNVTVADENGRAVTTHAHTIDGTWSCNLLRANKSYRITAWQPLPAPYQPKGECIARTNFDICCESVENMAQVIDIAKCGWTKEQIITWLQKEVEE